MDPHPGAGRCRRVVGRSMATDRPRAAGRPHSRTRPRPSHAVCMPAYQCAQHCVSSRRVGRECRADPRPHAGEYVYESAPEIRGGWRQDDSQPPVVETVLKDPHPPASRQCRSGRGGLLATDFRGNFRPPSARRAAAHAPIPPHPENLVALHSRPRCEHRPRATSLGPRPRPQARLRSRAASMRMRRALLWNNSM